MFRNAPLHLNAWTELPGKGNPLYPSPGWYAYQTSSADDTTRLWDLQSGLELHQFTGHKGPVEWAGFSPDGKTFVTGSDDGTVRIWSVDYRDMVNYLCTSLLHDFTNEEREQYHIREKFPPCSTM